MNLKEIEKVVASIQSHLFRNSNSFSVGMLKSHFKGAGLQFKEHQVYNPGDDVRFIDWKLSAKTNTTFIKTFEEERNVEISIFLDISETMFMGYKNVSKLQASIELCCLIFLLAEKSKDKVSVIICANEIKILPLVAGQEAIVLLISQLQSLGILTNEGKVNLNYNNKAFEDEKKKLSLLKSLVAKGKQVIVFSDLENIQSTDIVNKLLYRKNMHFFVMESPLDRMKSMPFSIYGKTKNKKRFGRVATSKEELELTGRYKKIGVHERYLENFVRDML